jgi:hypothetical protein
MRLGGLKIVVVVTVLFVIFHFTLGWSWRQTLLVPEILLVLLWGLAVYEFVIGKRRWDGTAQGGTLKTDSSTAVPKKDGTEGPAPAQAKVQNRTR